MVNISTQRKGLVGRKGMNRGVLLFMRWSGRDDVGMPYQMCSWTGSSWGPLSHNSLLDKGLGAQWDRHQHDLCKVK